MSKHVFLTGPPGNGGRRSQGSGARGSGSGAAAGAWFGAAWPAGLRGAVKRLEPGEGTCRRPQHLPGGCGSSRGASCCRPARQLPAGWPRSGVQACGCPPARVSHVEVRGAALINLFLMKAHFSSSSTHMAQMCPGATAFSLTFALQFSVGGKSPSGQLILLHLNH